LNYYIGGLDVFGYHLVNILIHLFSSIFLFLFIYHTLRLPSLEDKYASKSYAVAIFATMLWALNPIQTQAVTYIVQRMAALAGMFYIMGMYFYLKSRASIKKRDKILFICLCLFAFVMAFGSKENAVMLPMSLLLYETLIIQKELSKNFKKSLKIFFIVSGSFLFLCLIYLFLKDEPFSTFLSGYHHRPFTLIQRLFTESRVIIFYISLLVYPMLGRRSIDHSIQISTSPFNPVSTSLSILLILGIVIYLIVKARKYPLFSFCYLYFFLNHLIESSILPLELIMEHRNYIPSMMFFVPIAIGFCNLLERYARNRTRKTIIVAFIVFLMIGFGHTTFIRNLTWKSWKSLWMDAAKKAPDNFRVHHNLAMYHLDHGFNEKAISEFNKALRSPGIHRNDEKVVGLYQLGKLYYDLEDIVKAEFYLQKALRIKHNFSQALVTLASLYDKRGKTEFANQYLARALKSDPFNPAVNFNMGMHHLINARPDEAITHLTVSLNERDLRAKAFLYLGIAYRQKGWHGKAAITFQKSLSLDKKNILPHLHLAEIYHKTGHNLMRQQAVATIVNLMLRNETLFYQTIDLISQKGNLGNVYLSSELILNLMNEASKRKSESLTAWRAYIEKSIENAKKFE
jgi:Tfp pilus assembly protein PilF